MTSRIRLTLLGLALALAGCSDTAETLGLGRNPPDEFAVVERAPLSMPPVFSLRPPKPGAPRPQEVSMPDKAKTILFGTQRLELDGSESDAEKAFLAQCGADQAAPNIRTLIDEEAAQKVVGSPHLVERLLWWHDPSAYGRSTVDAAAERERIEQTKEKDEPINKGATPIIEKNESGWLGL